MRVPRAHIILGRIEPEQWTLAGLAACAGVHPALIEYFVDYGLIEPVARTGTQWLFDTACLARLRMIERLRRDLGGKSGWHYSADRRVRPEDGNGRTGPHPSFHCAHLC